MLTGLDRIQVTARDRDEVADCWRTLLDAKLVREDRVKCLGAERSVLAAGDCEVEILTPDGPGPVAEHVDRGLGGPFAAGFETADLDAVRARLESQSVRFEREGDQLFVSPEGMALPGLRLVVSPAAERPTVGLLRNLYETTHLTADAPGAAARIATVFGLDPAHFVPIRSDQFGYDGTLTLVDPDRLDRIETIHPFDGEKTMGRFFAKCGPCLYMSYGEADDTGAVRARLLEHAPDDWTGRSDDENPDGLFIHPKALGGVMLGVSRTTFAWSWSGSPQRVR